MYVVYDEAAAIREGRRDVYENWFKAYGIDRNQVLRKIGDSEYGDRYIKVSRPRGNWSLITNDFVEVDKSIYLPVVLNKDLGDYL